MNFKTTVILIVLLAAGAGYYFWSQSKPEKPAPTGEGVSLLDMPAATVTRISITSSDGPKLSLDKHGGAWQMQDPLSAPADSFEVDSLVRAIAEAKALNKVTPSADNAAELGLDHPRYTIELTDRNDRDATITVGQRVAVGSGVYVQAAGDSQAAVVGSDFIDRLEKPAETYRKANLVSVPSDQIHQVEIRTGGQTLALAKEGSDWKIIAPQHMPADASAVSDMLFSLSGLRATEFADKDGAALAGAPQLTVAFTSDLPVIAPATAPATEPVWTAVEFGRYDDILKKNVYVTVSSGDSDSGKVIAKVPVSSLDSFKKKPLDLRDKNVVDIDPDQISRIVLGIDLPAVTQPAGHPASSRKIVIERRKADSTLGPTTASTQAASSQPAAALSPKSKWLVDGGDAVDDRVASLAGDFHPLTAETYLESVPTTQPSGIYRITITTQAAGGVPPVDRTFVLTDRGESIQPVIACNGLNFEVSRVILTDLTTDMGKKPADAAGPRN